MAIPVVLQPRRHHGPAYQPARANEHAGSVSASVQVPFVGRREELALLTTWLTRAQRDQPLVAVVRGPSGMGKSALVSELTAYARRELSAVVLSGRCHAHEQVPFKAFDTLIDALALYLSELSAVEAAALMPRDAALLARLFPALARVRAVQRMPTRVRPHEDDALLRARAIAALKELLSRVADGDTLLLTLDDLQWSCRDSDDLLDALLRGPDAPPCLLLCVLRSDTARALPPVLAALPAARRLELWLTPLSTHDAGSLARALLGEHSLAEAGVARIVDEAAGSPFFLRELLRSARATGVVRGVRDVVLDRVATLDPAARDLLELAAVAGHPLEINQACLAGQVPVSALTGCIAASLLRSSTQRGRESIECAHDRFREAVLDALPGARRRTLHEQLARTLAADEHSDPEQVVLHFERAGLPVESAQYALRAAERASESFAFASAVELYRLAITHAAPEQTHALSLHLARALSGAGRVSEAALQYERCAATARTTSERHELGSRAMMLFLLAGNVPAGTELSRQLCRELGVLAPPRNRLLARLVIVTQLVRYLCGPRVVQLVPSTSAPCAREQRQLELRLRAMRGFVNWSVPHSLHFMLGAFLALRRTRDALRLPLAAAWELTGKAYARGRASERDEQSMACALERAIAVGDPEQHSLVLAAAGARLFYLSRLPEAAALFASSERVLDEAGLSVPTVCNANRSGRYAVWLAAGEYGQVLTVSERWLAESRAVGDPWGELVVRVMGSQRFLALDDPEQARASLAALDTPLGRLSPFGADPCWAGEIALYEGAAERAWVACQRAHESPYAREKRSGVLYRCWVAFMEARAALACGIWERRAPLLHAARRAQHQLARSPYAPAQAMRALIAATLASHAGDDNLALRELRAANEGFLASGMKSLAAAARFRRGRLLQGEAGAALRDEALATMRTLGMRNPECALRATAPGFDD